MTFFYFILDVCFYNYTGFKTDILLHSLLEKKEKKWVYFFSIFLIDFLLLARGRFFLLYSILYLLNRKIKGSFYRIGSIYMRFFILYIFYKLFVFLFFHTFVFEIFGFFLNLLLIFIMHKRF